MPLKQYTAAQHPYPAEVAPGACARCADLGYVLESVNGERFPSEVPCFMCMKYCAKCRKHARKATHECFKSS